MEQKSAGSSIITTVHLFLPHFSSRVVPQRDYKLQHMWLREEANLIQDMHLRWKWKGLWTRPGRPRSSAKSRSFFPVQTPSTSGALAERSDGIRSDFERSCRDGLRRHGFKLELTGHVHGTSALSPSVASFHANCNHNTRINSLISFKNWGGWRSAH